MELFPEYQDLPGAPEAPLADRMRPESFDGYLGQEHLVGEGRPLRRLIEKGAGVSFILWGPPGSGKTTLARLAARLTGSAFHEISAVAAGVAELRKVIAQARKTWRAEGRRTVLFIDEIHRFNKAQQDAVLPFIEDGTVRLIGSTAENPALEVIPALRSRCQVFRLNALSREDLGKIIDAALKDKGKGLGAAPLKLDKEARDLILRYAGGDARRALNVLEAVAVSSAGGVIGRETLEGILERTAVSYDKGATEHYDHASAFQKSLRGSDADAAVYWLGKMIAGGEDPRFITRRLLVTAAEDVGLADPAALTVALAAAAAADRLGWPEARIPLALAVIYVARAPKSNAAIRAIDRALDDIQRQGLSFPVPDHLKDTHYSDAKKYGFGVGYKYTHDHPGEAQEFLPPELGGRKYVDPPQTAGEANDDESPA
jgi:putative ATPase